MAEGRMKISARRDKIIELLKQKGRVSVTSLSKEFSTTEVTIRNDLSAMERDGLLMRVQGGAVLIPKAQESTTFDADIPNLASKQTIAKAVAEMIHDGDTLFINCGSTTMCVAEALKSRKNLNIVTNSIPVATCLSDVPTIRVLLLGGEVNSQYGFTYGANAQEQLGQYQAGWAILSVDGVSIPGGITTYHAEEAILDRMMIDGATHALIVADSSKMGRTGFSRICECDDKLTVITNGDNNASHELTSCGMQINYI